MARNSFNFQTKLGLETKDFKNGARQANNILNGLVSDFKHFAASIAAGLSIGAIFEKMKESALDLSVALNTLKNVSNNNGDVLSNYSTNLEYVRKLAEKYGQNILSLSESYAKFSAASRNSSLTMTQQQKIFTSLTRAAGYYHLSAEQTRDMTNAVVQMMSKGKVASEELRRQLGNTLPGAFNMMATAMGVSNEQLEKMMKAGRVAAADVLPRFAEELDKATAGGNFDNLQASINRLENAWLGFVKKSGFEGVWKTLIDWSTKGLNAVSENTNLIKHLIFGAFGSTLISYLRNSGNKAVAEMETTLAGMEARLRNYKATVKKMNMQSGGQYGVESHQTPNGGYYFSPQANVDERQKLKIVEMNNALLETEKIRKRLGQQPLLSPNDVDNIRRINQELGVIPERAQAGVSGFRQMKIAANGVLIAVKGIAKSLIIFELINIAISLITKGVEEIWKLMTANKREAERLQEITDTYNNNINEAVKAKETEVNEAKKLLKLVQDENISLTGRKQILEKIADITGKTELKKIDVKNLREGTAEYEKLAKAIDLWGKTVIKNAQIDIYAKQAAQAETEVDQLQIKLTELQDRIEKGTSVKKTVTGGVHPTAVSHKVLNADAKAAQKEMQSVLNEIETKQKFIDNAEAKLSTLTNDYAQLIEDYRNVGGSTGSGSDEVESSIKIKPLQQVYKDYLMQKKVLERQLKQGAIDQKKFNEEFDDLLIKTWKDAAASGEMDIAKLKASGAKTEIQKWYVQVAAQAAGAMVRETNKIFENLEKEMAKDLVKFAQEVDDYIAKDAAKVKPILDKIAEGSFNVQRGYRDALMDFTKDTEDILNDEVDITQDYIKNLSDKYEELGKVVKERGITRDSMSPIMITFLELERLLEAAQVDAEEFVKALAFAKTQRAIIDLKKELKSLNNELVDGTWSGISGFVNAIDSLVGAIDNLNKVMDDKDASNWEKFMAYFRVFENTINGILGTVRTFNAIMETSNAIREKEALLTLASAAAKKQEAAMVGTSAGAKIADAAASSKDAASTAGAAIASQANASAKAKEAVASTAAQNAKMGPLGWIGAAAGVAAIVALLSSMNKFAKGGIVGGTSRHGDRNLARLNSGEMILNRSQQGTLFNAIASGKLGGGGGEWRVKGADLIKCIENTKKRMRG